MVTRKTPAVRIACSAAFLVLALAIVPAALAGKPGGGGGGKGGGGTTGSGNLGLVLMDGATQPVYGGRVTFTVSTTATDRPFVGVRCWQGVNYVYDGYVGYFSSYLYDPWFTLSSPYWDGSSQASCTARLFYYDSRGGQHVLTTMNFVVNPSA